MYRTKVKFCDECGYYTRQIYKGRDGMSGEVKLRNVMLNILTLGIFSFVLRKIKGNSGFWECTKCGYMNEL